jgi:hypothetical protein
MNALMNSLDVWYVFQRPGRPAGSEVRTRSGLGILLLQEDKVRGEGGSEDMARHLVLRCTGTPQSWSTSAGSTESGPPD